MQIEASIRYLNGIAIVDLSGKLVAGQDADALQGLLFQALDQGHPKLLLNCAGLTQVDSGGLGDLVASCASLAKRGGLLKLLKPNRRLRELLQVTRLNSLFEVCEDESDAVTSFQGSGRS